MPSEWRKEACSSTEFMEAEMMTLAKALMKKAGQTEADWLTGLRVTVH